MWGTERDIGIASGWLVCVQRQVVDIFFSPALLCYIKTMTCGGGNKLKFSTWVKQVVQKAYSIK